MNRPFYDAHNHLQVETMAAHWETIIDQAQQSGIARLVVDGSTEADWKTVAHLAERFPAVLPSFGLHPWYLKERSGEWETTLNRFLDAHRGAVGEIGLDRLIENFDLPVQQKVFNAQMAIAAERNLPVTIHCLRAWGHLDQLLRNGPRPTRGFLLHSYGGSREMIQPMAKLGAYFSISGQYGHGWKQRQRENFRDVPADRLLIESDAPFMLPPSHMIRFPIHDEQGEELNHPANIVSAYEMVAKLRGESMEVLTKQVEENFLRFFAGL